MVAAAVPELAAHPFFLDGEQLPSELDELQQGLVDMSVERDVLDEFELLMPDDDFKSFWATLYWPKKIDEDIRRVTGALGV